MTYEKKVNDNFSPPKPGHTNSIDMTYKKKVNNNFSLTLNSIWPPGPGHKSSMNVTYKNYFFLILKLKGRECETDDFSPILKSNRPSGPDHQSFIDITCEKKVNNNFSPILNSIRSLRPG